MAENFKPFIDSFNKQLDEAIVKLTTKLDNYRSAREAAIRLKDPIDLTIGGTSFKTVGDLFAFVYPNEDGGVQNIPFEVTSTIITSFSGKDASAESKKSYESLKKGWNASINLDKELSLKKSGAENWVDSFTSKFYKKLAENKIKASEIKEEDFEEMLVSMDINVPHGESGLLYKGIVEASESKSQINAPEEKPNVEPTVVSQINESEKPAEKPVEPSAINPEKQTKGKTEEVKKTESAVITSAAEVPKEEAKPETPININLETKEPKEEDVIIQPTIPSPTVPGPLSSEKTTVTSENTTVSSEKNTIVDQPIIQPTISTVSSINETKTSSTTNMVDKQLTSSLKELFGGEGGLSDKEIADLQNKMVEDVKNESTLESITTDKNTINETSENVTNSAKSKINKVSSTVNEKTSEVESKVSKTKEQIAAEEKYIKSFFGIEDETSTAPKTSTESKTQPGIELTKTSPSFPEKIAPNPQAETGSQVNTPVASSGESVTMNEVSSESTSTQAPNGATNTAPSEGGVSAGAGSGSTSAAGGTNVDFSGVEHRLARLEYLLSSPLEVKIVR